jgi:mxaJ protein
MKRCMHRTFRSTALGLAALVMQANVSLAGATPLPGADHGTAGESANSSAPDQGALRVCADPNNMPFSNAAGEGFENRLAELLGRALHEKVEYTWWAQRRAFVRNTLNAGKCDVIMGVPAGFGPVATTRPYYASRYVFVYRKDRGFHLESLADPKLAHLKIGVHLIGSDSTPPALVLAQRGLTNNIVGYSIFGDYRLPNPPANLIHAVANGDIDVAVVWGPLAGYFASREPVPLQLVPLADMPGPLPLTFAIAIGVRKADSALQQRLEAALLENQPEIAALLEAYGVPLASVQTANAR